MTPVEARQIAYRYAKTCARNCREWYEWEDNLPTDVLKALSPREVQAIVAMVWGVPMPQEKQHEQT